MRKTNKILAEILSAVVLNEPCNYMGRPEYYR